MNIEFSIDGGVIYFYNINDNVGSYMIIDLFVGVYDLWICWGNDECLINLLDVLIV